MHGKASQYTERKQKERKINEMENDKLKKETGELGGEVKQE